MTDNSLVIDRVRHTYQGGNAILHDISMQVAKGEFVTLLGPSGCGKTTLLRIIAGFLRPSQGNVFLQGRNVTDEPAHKRKVNLVFQRVTLFPHLDVFENVAFGMRLAKKPEREIKSRVAECLAMVRLEGFEHRQVASLSGGQAQRVSLARALANRPEVLLLDEPLSALDLKVRLDLEAELRRLHRSEGLTAIYVTHDQREALALSDRIALFNKGHIDQLASPAEIYRQPATPFAAQFVGDANVLDGSVSHDGDQSVVTVHGAKYHLPHSMEKTGKIVLVLRQEDVLLEKVGASQAHALTGKIVDMGYRGSGFSCQVLVNGLDKLIKAEIPASQGDALTVGAEVTISWDPAKAWIISA
jgi:spermidine/putrescine transport system ATP-binding protein